MFESGVAYTSSESRSILRYMNRIVNKVGFSLAGLPELARREGGSFSQRPQLGPLDRRVHPADVRALGEAAVGAAHHVLAADDTSEPGKALRHQFGMFDNVRV